MDSLIDISLDDLMELTQRAEGFARQRRIAAVKVGDIMSTGDHRPPGNHPEHHRPPADQ
ncbi:MAG: hypothetical protein R3E89_10675 [Thiolinea sp.]